MQTGSVGSSPTARVIGYSSVVERQLRKNTVLFLFPAIDFRDGSAYRASDGTH